MWFGIRRCELGPIVGAGQAEGAPCRPNGWLSFGEVLLGPEGQHDPDCEEPEDCHLMTPVLELEQVLNRNSGLCSVSLWAVWNSHLKSVLPVTICLRPTLQGQGPGRPGWEGHGGDKGAECLWHLCYCLSPRFPHA